MTILYTRRREFELPDIPNCKSIRIRIAWVDEELIDARDPRGAADGGNDGFISANLSLFNEAACE